MVSTCHELESRILLAFGEGVLSCCARLLFVSVRLLSVRVQRVRKEILHDSPPSRHTSCKHGDGMTYMLLGEEPRPIKFEEPYIKKPEGCRELR